MLVCCFDLVTWLLLCMGALWSVLLWLMVWVCWFVEYFELFVCIVIDDVRCFSVVVMWIWVCVTSFVGVSWFVWVCFVLSWVGMFTVRFINWLYCLVGSLFWLLVFGLPLLLTLSFLLLVYYCGNWWLLLHFA